MMFLGLVVAATIPTNAGGNAGQLDRQLSWRRLNTFRRGGGAGGAEGGGDGAPGGAAGLGGSTDDLGSGLLAAGAAEDGGAKVEGLSAGEEVLEEVLETKGLLEDHLGAHHRKGSFRGP